MDTLVKEPLRTVWIDQPRVTTAAALPATTAGVTGRKQPARKPVWVALSHHDAAVLASRLADDLQLATWEDAEWR